MFTTAVRSWARPQCSVTGKSFNMVIVRYTTWSIIYFVKIMDVEDVLGPGENAECERFR